MFAFLQGWWILHDFKKIYIVCSMNMLLKIAKREEACNSAGHLIMMYNYLASEFLIFLKYSCKASDCSCLLCLNIFWWVLDVGEQFQADGPPSDAVAAGTHAFTASVSPGFSGRPQLAPAAVDGHLQGHENKHSDLDSDDETETISSWEKERKVSSFLFLVISHWCWSLCITAHIFAAWQPYFHTSGHASSIHDIV